MFPNNPFYVEKLVHTKQEDILRILPDRHAPEFRAGYRFDFRSKVRLKIWVPAGLLLAWLIRVILSAKAKCHTERVGLERNDKVSIYNTSYE